MSSRSRYLDPVTDVNLLSCPFCGSKAVMDRMHTEAESFWRHRARCTVCWCATDWESESPEDCEKKWNERAVADNGRNEVTNNG